MRAELNRALSLAMSLSLFQPRALFIDTRADPGAAGRNTDAGGIVSVSLPSNVSGCVGLKLERATIPNAWFTFDGEIPVLYVCELIGLENYFNDGLTGLANFFYQTGANLNQTSDVQLSQLSAQIIAEDAATNVFQTKIGLEREWAAASMVKTPTTMAQFLTTPTFIYNYAEGMYNPNDVTRTPMHRTSWFKLEIPRDKIYANAADLETEFNMAGQSTNGLPTVLPGDPGTNPIASVVGQAAQQSGSYAALVDANTHRLGIYSNGATIGVQGDGSPGWALSDNAATDWAVGDNPAVGAPTGSYSRVWFITSTPPAFYMNPSTAALYPSSNDLLPASAPELGFTTLPDPTVSFFRGDVAMGQKRYSPYPQNIYVSTTLTHNSMSNNNRTDILAQIPVTAPSGGVIIYEANASTPCALLDTRDFNEITMRLTYIDGTPVDLNGESWACSLVLEYMDREQVAAEGGS